MINVDNVPIFAGILLAVIMLYSFRFSRNADIKIKVLNYSFLLWVLNLFLYFYIIYKNLLSSFIIMVPVGILAIISFKLRNKWVAFCNQCGKTIYFPLGDKTCPQCKHTDSLL